MGDIEFGGVGSMPRCLEGREAEVVCTLVPVWPASRDFGISTEGDCCVAKATAMLEIGLVFMLAMSRVYRRLQSSYGRVPALLVVSQMRKSGDV